MNTRLFIIAFVLGASIAACGDDSPSVPTFGPGDATVTSDTTAPRTTTTIAEPATVALSIEPVQGFFIEGFEIAIRFEDGAGKTIASMYWTDFVQSLRDPSLEDYYESVLTQSVPAGPITVLAQTAVGMGPPPIRPDLAGDLTCRLDLDLEPGARVEVEIRFSDAVDCLALKEA